jgi:hypothetical protein
MELAHALIGEKLSEFNGGMKIRIEHKKRDYQ